uniref:Uncharacterized protein LOC105040978 isoform X2 n=1 Tax=Elaeis guineensis var. tenera TaxID=51953 RepID=A0A6I9QVK9_ELAGV|nr:uncharacterized protein LOC105040978 isoform X2 [Elaeis guineensis]
MRSLLTGVLRSSKSSISRSSLCRSPLPPPSLPCFSSRKPYFRVGGFFSHETLTQKAIPGDFLKWAAMGFQRGSRFAAGYTPLQPKPLDSIIDIERAKTRSTEDLVSIWDDMPHILFTGLEDYKARGTQASPYFTVTHYTEFSESKDVVLIRGDVVFTSKLSDSEARWLLDTVQSFYLNDVRYKLVERFNKETHEFEFKDVLQALEMPTV